MEEHAVADRLQHSRAQLRAMLLPDPETGRIEADVFPRSAVMRFLLDPRRRGMATAGLAALGMLAGRRTGRNALSRLIPMVGRFFLARRR